MNDLKNWTKVTRGLYRYVVAAGACYEIHVITWDCSTDIMSADAIAYCVGTWTSAKTEKQVFEREELCHGPLCACIQAAIEDYRQLQED